MKRFTKEEMFTPLEEEVTIPIDFGMNNFDFTRKWFLSRNIKTWSTFLPLKYSNERPINMLQIGVFEGMDLVWCMQHIAGHPDSRVFAIDPWAATNKLDHVYMEGVYQRAQRNLSPWISRICLMRGYSDSVMELMKHGAQHNKTIIYPDGWDLIVVDGDHTADAVYTDARLAFDLIKPGGWVIFDDVRNRVEKKDHVVHGLERFVDNQTDHALKFEWAHRYCDCWSKI